ARRLQRHRRSPNRHQPFPARDQRQSQTLRVDRRPRCHHRQGAPRETSVSVDPLVLLPFQYSWSFRVGLQTHVDEIKQIAEDEFTLTTAWNEWQALPPRLPRQSNQHGRETARSESRGFPGVWKGATLG